MAEYPLASQSLSLGKYEADVLSLVKSWDESGNVARLWKRDASLFSGADEARWMAWLDIVDEQLKDTSHLAKATADAARNVDGSSMVTAMVISCRGFAIRVSGLGDEWIKGPYPQIQAKLFGNHTEDEITWMGGESIIAETIGLGGFAQANAPALQKYQGGSANAMIERNQELYQITIGENPDYHIPVLNYRGTPTGIDIFKVVETGVLPAMDIGVAGRDGGQIGAGIVRAPMECFTEAVKKYNARYGGGR